MSIALTRSGTVTGAVLARAPASTSDEMLVKRIAAGDKLAMQVLFARHRTPVYRWLLRFVGNETVAEDLLSDVFFDVWQQAGHLKAGRRHHLAALDRALQGALGAPPSNSCRIERGDRGHCCQLC